MNEEQNENKTKQKSTEIAIVDENTIRDKIYVVHGVQVIGHRQNRKRFLEIISALRF